MLKGEKQATVACDPVSNLDDVWVLNPLLVLYISIFFVVDIADHFDAYLLLRISITSFEDFVVLRALVRLDEPRQLILHREPSLLIKRNASTSLMTSDSPAA